MNFFRNPEIKRGCLLFLAVTVIFTGAGFFFGRSFGIFTFLLCAIFTALHLSFTFFRYRHICHLSRELDKVLHDANAMSFSDYSEGELSILKIEIDKMLLRLREQSEQLKQDKLSLASSMADISHQIRTPLTSIRLVLSLLSDPNPDSQRRTELLQQLSVLVSRIDWLIEALLKIARLDAGTITLKPEPISIARLIRAAVEPLEIPMELREQHLLFSEKTEPSEKPVFIMCDYSWTVEAIANILKNCMEHTPMGGNIQICFSENPIFTELVIEDSGPGFCKEDLPHLFERFYKGKDSSTQSVGIGLALARMIFSRQNATVKAENRTEGGARFTIHFYKDLSVSSDNIVT